MNDSLTYGDLSIGREIRNPHTNESAKITALGNALVEITLTDGPDAGEEVTMSPAEVATYWHKA